MRDTVSYNVAQPLVRMNLEDDPLLFKDGEVSFALNAIAGKGFYKNAKGNKIAAALPSGFLLIGKEPIDTRQQLIICTNPTTGVGQIGIFSNGVYTVKSSSVKYNFKIYKQVQAKIKKTYLGQLVVYMTDNFNPMRRVNLDDIPMINGDIDIDAINVFQNYTIPNITVTEILENGALLSGTYFIIAQYADANGNALSAWFTPVGPIPIIKDSLSDGADFIEGVLSNQGTNKAIKVHFTNTDLSYKYMNVGFIKKAEGVSRCFKVDTITVTHQDYIFNGSGNIPEEITLEEVTQPVVSYRTAKTVEVVNKDLLMWGNLTGRKTYNLQSYFNNVQVQWQIDRQLSSDNATNFSNPLSSTYRRVFRHGENYIIGIVLIYKDGSKSQVFVFPGRQLNKNAAGQTITKTLDSYNQSVFQGQWDSYTILTNDNTDGIAANTPRWKVYNTAFAVGDDIPVNGFTGKSTFGEMGYFESTERYPNDPRVWGANAGQPIRLHQMPDDTVWPLFEKDDILTPNAPEAPVYLNYLGIRFPNIQNVINSLPADIKDDIQGWEIVVGDRENNKSIVATGLLYNTLYNNWRAKYTGADDVRLYSNYPFNSLGKDAYYYKYPGLPEGWDEAFHTPQENEAYLNDQVKKDIFTFVSPETSFRKSFLNGGRMKVLGEMYGKSKGLYAYVSPYPRFDDSKTGSSSDYSAYHNYNVGWYNNFKSVSFNNAVRKIKDSVYVPFNSQVSTGNIGLPFQNLLAESTVALAVTKPIADTTVVDNSREIMGGNPAAGNPITYELYFPNNAIERNVSSYYVSICRIIENQYGNIFNVKWRTTNFNNYNVTNNSLVFGGDTFIGKFSMKRQHIFFQNAQSYMNWADDQKVIDLRYGPTFAQTRFYAYVKDDTRGDSRTLWPGDTHLGFTPLIVSGIPVFYTECDDNLNFRLNGQLEFETYYNNLLNGSVSLQAWSGIKYIDKDNYYAINEDFSALNIYTFYDNGNPSYDPDNDNGLQFYGRTIYSLSSAPEDIFDNWKVYLPLNYYDFPKTEGPIQDIKDIGNYRTLFRLQNGLFVDRLYSIIETTEDGLNLGSGKMFEKKPDKLVTSDNQYGGTVSQWAFNNTPFGAFMVDVERGIAFQIGETLKDISADKAATWFFENLTYKLTHDIPGFGNLDNPANPQGIGVLSVFDAENKLWILTKKDYRLVNPLNASKYEFKNNQIYFNNAPVSLFDDAHFANCSFTISYSVLNQGWGSFHNHIPDYYFNIGNLLYSGVNTQSTNNLYSHDGNAYHTYYSKSYPHIIETVIKNENLNVFSNLYYSFITKSFIEKARGRVGEQKFVTFNKSIIYNSSQCSGLLRLMVQDENDLSTLLDLGTEANTRRLGLRRIGSEFVFSNIYDIANSDYGNEGFFTAEWPFIKSEYYIDKVLDNTFLDYARDYTEEAPIQDMYNRMRLILDNRNDVSITTYITGIASQFQVR